MAGNTDVDELKLASELEAIGLELQGCIDTGGYAAVFKAVSRGAGQLNPDGRNESQESFTWQGEAGNVFAVKILLASMWNTDCMRDFKREALLLSRVDHPGRGLHSFTSQLNLSVFFWIGGARRGLCSPS